MEIYKDPGPEIMNVPWRGRKDKILHSNSAEGIHSAYNWPYILSLAQNWYEEGPGEYKVDGRWTVACHFLPFSQMAWGEKK